MMVRKRGGEVTVCRRSSALLSGNLGRKSPDRGASTAEIRHWSPASSKSSASSGYRRSEEIGNAAHVVKNVWQQQEQLWSMTTIGQSHGSASGITDSAGQPESRTTDPARSQHRSSASPSCCLCCVACSIQQAELHPEPPIL